jgi:cyclophilin family peptidyl-prolyl cis-trans isomerase
MIRALLLLAFLAADPPAEYRVRFTTLQGEFTVAAHRAWAPHAADRFLELVRAGYFDDSRFFRVVPGYIAQFGIAGDPKVAALWRNRTIPADPEHGPNTRGTVAFAMITPDARTTQVYINLADNRKRIDGQGFATFGEVVAGMDVVERLYAGYGETSGGGLRAGRQDRLYEGGNRYLDKAFPRLDRIVRARVE